MTWSPESVREYAYNLGAKYQAIASIWLFGSRANNRAHEQSDWDLVMFGPRELAEILTQDLVMQQEGIDLMVVDEASWEFRKPWSSAPEEWESFQGWHWKVLSDQDAEYRATKFRGKLILLGGELVEAGPLEVSQQRAIKLW